MSVEGGIRKRRPRRANRRKSPQEPHGRCRPRSRRLRYGKLPAPAAKADLYWGKSQPELAQLTDGQLTKLILDSPEFGEVLGPKHEAIDGRSRTGRGKTQGRPTRWSALKLESLMVYRRISGQSTVKRARERLSFDSEACVLLGFTGEIPSSPTITRYLRQHFDADERLCLYRELDRKLRRRVMLLDGFDEEARKLGLDGSQHGTAYTPPIPATDANGQTNGGFLNADIQAGQAGAITAPTAGIVGGDGPKSGRGWQFVGLFTEHGTLCAWDISALNESEYSAAERVLDAYEETVMPHRDPTTLSVCTADGGFSSARLRQRLQDLRVVPNIHKASHGGSERSLESVRNKDASFWPFEHPTKQHYAKWFANGHDEIRCHCGEGVTERVFEIGKGGGLTIAVKGSCPECGSIRITAGKWRRAQNPKRITMAFAEEGDPAIGNALTFHDHLAREYGKDRFGWGESLHATLNRRFGLLKARSWMRSKTEVETEFAIAASAISTLLLERADRREAIRAQVDAIEI